MCCTCHVVCHPQQDLIASFTTLFKFWFTAWNKIAVQNWHGDIQMRCAIPTSGTKSRITILMARCNFANGQLAVTGGVHHLTVRTSRVRTVAGAAAAAAGTGLVLSGTEQARPASLFSPVSLNTEFWCLATLGYCMCHRPEAATFGSPTTNFIWHFIHK